MSKLLWMVILMTVLSTYYASAYQRKCLGNNQIQKLQLPSIDSNRQDTIIVEPDFSGICNYEYVTPEPEGYNYSRPGYVYEIPKVKLTTVTTTPTTKPTLGNIYLPPKTTTTTTTTTPKPTYLPPPVPYTYLPPSKPPIVYLPVRKSPPPYPSTKPGRISTTKAPTTKYKPYTSRAPPPTLPPSTTKIPIIRGYEYLPPKKSLKYPNEEFKIFKYKNI